MSLGYAVVIPTFVFLDPNLAPIEKMLYGALSSLANSNGYCVADNLTLAKLLKVKSDDTMKQPSPDTITKMIDHLLQLGYVKVTDENGERAVVVIYQKSSVDVKVNSIKKPPIPSDYDATAVKVLEYLSTASITRGYKKTAYKPTKANLEYIRARLADKHTYEECISVINIKFEDEFFQKNTKYLSPQTLFRPSKFETYLSQSEQVKGIESKVVSKFGLSSPTTAPQSNVEGVSF